MELPVSVWDDDGDPVPRRAVPGHGPAPRAQVRELRLDLLHRRRHLRGKGHPDGPPESRWDHGAGREKAGGQFNSFVEISVLRAIGGPTNVQNVCKTCLKLLFCL